MNNYQTKLTDATPGQWHPVPWGAGEVMMPAWDTRESIYARLTQPDQMAMARSLGARLMSLAEAQSLIRLGGWIEPVLAGAAMARGEGAWLSTYHLVDSVIRERLVNAAPPLLVAKVWLDDPQGRAMNYGLPRRRGDSSSVWQSPGTRHDAERARFVDYSQLAQFYRPAAGASNGVTTMRQTVRLGSKGVDVSRWQEIIGVSVDGSFGPRTDRATREWQLAHRLVPDGIVGARTWAAAGETPLISTSLLGPSPACLAALRDANLAWPHRSKVSDGIMGDASHMARKSDHNLGNAVDITHDLVAGCDGSIISRLAIRDPRVSYVIWSREIANPMIEGGRWRPYAGSNPHTHHCHVSVRTEARNDDGPWPWAP